VYEAIFWEATGVVEVLGTVHSTSSVHVAIIISERKNTKRVLYERLTAKSNER
jgi:hypothetical protein